MRNSRTAVIILALAAFATAEAQDFLSCSEIGVAGGGMNYSGDLNKQSIAGKVGLSAALLYRYKLDDRWAVSLCAATGRIEGGNPDAERRRNLSFRSQVTEMSARMEFNFVPFGASGMRFRTSPYIFCGLGVFHYNPKGYYHNLSDDSWQWVELQPLHTEGQGSEAYPDRSPYMLTQLSVPFGLGFKMAFSETLTLAVEYGFRKTWTDYLDDVSTTYVGAGLLGEGTVAAAMADRSGEVEQDYVNAVGIKRGDDSLNDAYAVFNVSLSVSLDAVLGWTRRRHCD